MTGQWIDQNSGYILYNCTAFSYRYISSVNITNKVYDIIPRRKTMTNKNGTMKIGRYCDYGDVNIKVNDSYSNSTMIYLETSDNNTKIKFIDKFANLLHMSVLILSDTENTFNELKY